MLTADYIVVGAGLTGATIARTLVDAGREVVVLERRDTLGGNVADTVHEASGIRYNVYGPHYARTSSDRVWDFMTRFATFRPFQARVLTDVGAGNFEPWPLSARTVAKYAGPDWRLFLGQYSAPTNFEEATLNKVPQNVYRLFIKEYTEKQWGIPCTELTASLARRFDVRTDDDPFLTPRAKYQGLPVHGYTAWVDEMLRDVPVTFNCDYLALREHFIARKKLIFTGPIDAYFNYELGALPYRGQRREHTYLPSFIGHYQRCGQVNNPLHRNGAHVRTIEWKHFLTPDDGAQVKGTLLTQEYPIAASTPDECEYPVPSLAGRKSYGEYRKRASALEKVLVAGRLGEAKYFDMDGAIARALTLGERLLKEKT